MSAQPEVTGEPLGLGVLGCGDIAWRTMVPAMLRVPGVRMVAYASRDGVKARRFADRYGGEPVTGYRRLLEHPGVDAVYVAVPTGLHHEWAAAALSAGKHVLCEKPLTTTRDGTADLLDLAARRGLRLTDNFGFVHHEQHRVVRRLLDEGQIGEIRSVSAEFGIPPRPAGDVRYRADLGGGALLDVGSYTVRAALMWLGDDLTCAGATLRRDPAGGVDHGGSALLRTPDGVSAQLHFDFASSYRSACTIWGSAGRVTLTRAFTPPPTLRPTVLVERQDERRELTVAADDQFANLVAGFARGIREKTPPGAAEHTLLRLAALVDDIRDA